MIAIKVKTFNVQNNLDLLNADPVKDVMPARLQLVAVYEVYGVKGFAQREGQMPGPWVVLRQLADLLEAEARGDFAPDKMQ